MEAYFILFFLLFILVWVIEVQLLKRWVFVYYDFSLPIFIRRVTPSFYEPLDGKLSRKQKNEIGSKYKFETQLVNKAENNTLYYHKYTLDTYSDNGLRVRAFGRLKQEHDGTLTFYGSLSSTSFIYLAGIFLFPFLSTEIDLFFILILLVTVLAALFFQWWSYSQLADVLLPQTKDSHF